MGVDVYLENQIHDRTYAGREVNEQFSRVLAVSNGEGLLVGVHLHGDTMFNAVQLRKLDSEIEVISVQYPNLRSDVQALRGIFRKVIEDRGYLWLSGD